MTDLKFSLFLAVLFGFCMLLLEGSFEGLELHEESWSQI